MEAGYYIMEKQELHIGFELDVLILQSKYDDKKELWSKVKINELDDLFNSYNGMTLEGNIDAKYCRVKYLDKEDIESLGWGFIKLHPGTTSYDFEFGDLFLSFDPDFGPKWNLRIYEGEDCDNEMNRFNGFIKNKSEFIKIMQQIGILENNNLK